MSLTRESAVFQSLASAIESELVLRGVDVDAQTVDVALNEHIAQAATTYASVSRRPWRRCRIWP